MPRTCVFCESGKPTREHALPVWISAELPGGGPFRFDQGGKQWLSKDAGKVVKAVCGGCNNGSMSDFEGQAKPFLAPAIRGERFLLAIPDQVTVATWAAKTALMCEQARLAAPGDSVSRTQHRHLFRHKEPAPGTHVWMAAYRGHKMAWVEQHRLDLRGSTESDSGLTTTMSIGQLVRQVLARCPSTCESSRPRRYHAFGRILREPSRSRPESLSAIRKSKRFLARCCRLSRRRARRHDSGRRWPTSMAALAAGPRRGKAPHERPSSDPQYFFCVRSTESGLRSRKRRCLAALRHFSSQNCLRSSAVAGSEVRQFKHLRSPDTSAHADR